MRRLRKTRGRNFIGMSYGINVETDEAEPLRGASLRFDDVSGASVAPQDLIIQNGLSVDKRRCMGTNDPGKMRVYEEMSMVFYDPAMGVQRNPCGE